MRIFPRCMAIVLSACLVVPAEFTLAQDCLAPRSTFDTSDERSEQRHAGHLKDEQAPVRGTDLLGGPGTDRREMAGGQVAMRSYIAKILAAELRMQEAALRDKLKAVRQSQVQSMYEVLESWGGVIPSHWVIPTKLKDVIWFLCAYNKYRNAEIVDPSVYRDNARYVCREIQKIFSSPSGSRDILKIFLENTFYPERDEESPLHCACTLQRMVELSPSLGEIIFLQSLGNDNLRTFLLIYQSMPDRSVFKKCVLESLDIVPQEMLKVFLGKGTPLPAEKDVRVLQAFKAFERANKKTPTLKELHVTATQLATAPKGHASIPLKRKAIAQSVTRLNKLYHCNILLSDLAYGFLPERLLDVRQKKRLSQQQLEKVSGVDAYTVHRYEKGEAIPRTENLMKIAASVGVDPHYFIGSAHAEVRSERLDPERLKRAREAKGLYQGELAKAIGEGQWVIARLETGKRIADEKDRVLIEKIAVELDVTYKFLMGLEERTLAVRFLPERFIRARTHRGWSVNKAMHELGVVFATIKGWEAGTSMPTNAQLKMMSEKMQVSLKFLAGEEDLELKTPVFSAQRMKAQRIRLALTQPELAALMAKRGYGSSDISTWENGLKIPYEKNLVGLALALGVTKEFLLCLEGKDMDMPLFVPRRLKECRMRAGYSRKTLATMIGDISGHVQSLEEGNTIPQIPTVRKIAQALNVSYGYLMGFEDTIRPGDIADMDLTRKVLDPSVPRARRLGILILEAYRSYVAAHAKIPTANALIEAVQRLGLKIQDIKADLSFKRSAIIQTVVDLNRKEKALIVLTDHAYGFSCERIKETREKLRMTQEELAEKAGLSRLSIYLYEKGAHTPSTDALQKIADVFGVDILYLFGGDALDVRFPQFDPARLRLAREAKGLTQEALGKILGGLTWQIPKWEAGEALPKDKSLIEKIALALDVTHGYLVGLEDLTLKPVVKSRFHPERLRAARLHKGWSEERAARELGVTAGDIRNWENSTISPKPKQIALLAEKLEVPQEFLMGEMELDLTPLPMDVVGEFRPDRLKNARLRAGLTRKEVAQMLGYKNEAILYNWEEGNHVPEDENVEGLMGVLYVTKGYLMGTEPEVMHMVQGNGVVRPILSGTRLGLAMGYRAISKKDLASALGVTPDQAETWMGEYREVPFDVICKMADVFGVRPNFLTGMGSPFKPDRIKAVARFTGANVPPTLEKFDEDNPPLSVAQELGAMVRHHHIPYDYFTGKADIEFPATSIAHEKIAQYRKGKGFSQGDLARSIGIGWYQTIISQLEKGKKGMTLDQLGHVASVLDIPPSALLKNPKATLADTVALSGPLVARVKGTPADLLVRGHGAREVFHEEPQPGDLALEMVKRDIALLTDAESDDAFELLDILAEDGGNSYLYRHTNTGIQVYKKERQIYDREALELLMANPVKYCCPILGVGDGFYYELDLEPYGYKSLYPVLIKALRKADSPETQAFIQSVLACLYPISEARLEHWDLHWANVLMKRDTGAIRIIDYERLRRSESVEKALRSNLLNFSRTRAVKKVAQNILDGRNSRASRVAPRPVGVNEQRDVDEAIQRAA